MFKTMSKRLEALEALSGGGGPLIVIRFVCAADGQVVPFRKVKARDGRVWEMQDGEDQSALLERAKADAMGGTSATTLLCMG